MEPAITASSNDFVRRWVTAISRVPVLFDGLRWGLEGGFLRHDEMIRRHLPNRAIQVLDCGCGTGIYAKHFVSDGYVGIDVSNAYLERARRRNPGYRFECMDAKDTSFASGTFDAVLISGVVHHLSSDEASQVIAEAHRVLSPTGILLLWEDVPTRNRFNLIGKIVHHYDMGPFIRPSSDYATLLHNCFRTETTEEFCSGFMDYSVFRCRPKTLDGRERI